MDSEKRRHNGKCRDRILTVKNDMDKERAYKDKEAVTEIIQKHIEYRETETHQPERRTNTKAYTDYAREKPADYVPRDC